MPGFRADPGEAARITGAFDETFSRWEIALPREAVERGEPWLIRRAGWTIRCVFGADGEGSYLEYYATHRMTSDSRVGIYTSGRTVEMDAIWEMFMWDPKKPVTRRAEGVRRPQRAHRRRAQAARALPDGDINAYLRTEGPPDE